MKGLAHLRVNIYWNFPQPLRYMYSTAWYICDFFVHIYTFLTAKESSASHGVTGSLILFFHFGSIFWQKAERKHGVKSVHALTLESRIRSAALDRFPSLWALLMLAALPPLQAEAGPPEALHHTKIQPLVKKLLTTEGMLDQLEEQSISAAEVCEETHNLSKDRPLPYFPISPRVCSAASHLPQSWRRWSRWRSWRSWPCWRCCCWLRWPPLCWRCCGCSSSSPLWCCWPAAWGRAPGCSYAPERSARDTDDENAAFHQDLPSLFYCWKLWGMQMCLKSSIIKSSTF